MVAVGSGVSVGTGEGATVGTVWATVVGCSAGVSDSPPQETIANDMRASRPKPDMWKNRFMASIL